MEDATAPASSGGDTNKDDPNVVAKIDLPATALDGDIHKDTNVADLDPFATSTEDPSVDEAEEFFNNDDNTAAAPSSLAVNSGSTVPISTPADDAVATDVTQDRVAVPDDTTNNASTHSIAHFHDHFTMLIPSSTVRYRDGHSAARVIESVDCQFVLEETMETTENKNKRVISIRRIPITSQGERFLRVSYAIVTAFWTGFFLCFASKLFCFCS